MHPADAEAIEWDDDNEAHLAAHRISANEVAEVLASTPTWLANVAGRSGDWKAIGETTGGRQLTVVVATNETRRTIRPITGWDSTSKERRQR